MSNKTKAIFRLVYVSILLFINLIVAISSSSEQLTSFAGYVKDGLDQVSPNYVSTKVWYWTGYLFSVATGHRLDVPDQPDLGLFDQSVLEQLDQSPHSGGLVGIIVLSAAVILTYFAQEEGGRLKRLTFALLGSSLMALILKWLLIILVKLLSVIIGLALWLNAVVIASIEGLLHLHDIYKGTKEVQDAAGEIGKTGKHQSLAPTEQNSATAADTEPTQTARSSDAG